MSSEKQPIDATAESSSPPPVPVVDASRRALIRAAVLSVPLVLTLTSNASAQSGTYGYASVATM